MAKATVTDEAAAFVFGGDPASEPAKSTDKITAKATKKSTEKNKAKSKVKPTAINTAKSAAAAVLFGNMTTGGKAKPKCYTILQFYWCTCDQESPTVREWGAICLNSRVMSERGEVAMCDSFLHERLKS